MPAVTAHLFSAAQPGKAASGHQQLCVFLCCASHPHRMCDRHSRSHVSGVPSYVGATRYRRVRRASPQGSSHCLIEAAWSHPNGTVLPIHHGTVGETLGLVPMSLLAAGAADELQALHPAAASSARRSRQAPDCARRVAQTPVETAGFGYDGTVAPAGRRSPGWIGRWLVTAAAGSGRKASVEVT